VSLFLYVGSLFTGHKKVNIMHKWILVNWGIWFNSKVIHGNATKQALTNIEIPQNAYLL